MQFGFDLIRGDVGRKHADIGVSGDAVDQKKNNHGNPKHNKRRL
jgi:hypothetical protein